MFFINFSFSLSLTLKGSIDNLRSKIERNLKTKVGGKAIINDIYLLSLDKIQQEEASPIFLAIRQLIDYLNSKYYCNINEQEVLSILYYSNAELKRDLKINLQEFEKPNKSDLGKYCSKLNSCVFNYEKGRSLNTPSLNNQCQSYLNTMFLSVYTNLFYSWNIGGAFKESALFWNGSLDDSSYDILSDVHKLSEIMFESVSPPAKILFFEMPTVNYNSQNTTTNNSNNSNNINNSNNTGFPQTTGNQNTSTNNSNNTGSPTRSDNTIITRSDNTNQNIITQSNYDNGLSIKENNSFTNKIEKDNIVISPSDLNQNNIYNSFDSQQEQTYVVGATQDIIEFIETVNVSNPTISIAGNQCIEGFDTEMYTINITGSHFIKTENVVSATDYLEIVLADINKFSCNEDGICQDREGSTCSDCFLDEGTGDVEEMKEYVKSLIDRQIIAEENTIFFRSGTPNNQSQDEVVVNVGCLQKCEELDCNPLNCDKLICYAKCFCQSYSYSYDIGKAGITSAFKLKFCPIPAVGVEPKKSKFVYNISAVFLEIYNALHSLRNSGELGINIKSKEFLDINKMKTSFSEVLSFSVNSSIGDLTRNESEAVQKDEQTNLNSNLMIAILGFSKEANVDLEKNKYVVMDEPCSYEIGVNVSSIDEKEASIAACKQEKTENKLTLDHVDLESVVKDQQVILINSDIADFMSNNSDFWQKVKDVFIDFVALAETLSKK